MDAKETMETNSFEALNGLDVATIEQEVFKHTASAIYFYGDNCNVCLALRPKIYQLLKEKFPQVKGYQIDAEKETQTCAHFSVFNIPVLIVYFEGREFKRYGRFASLSEMEQDISRPYEMLFT